MNKLYIATMILLSLTTQAQTTYNVSWAELVGVTVNADNTLSRTSGTAWAAGAAGRNVLPKATDGYVQFTWAAGSNIYMIGLARFNPDATHTSIDYAMYLSGTSIGVYESGTSKGGFGTAVAGDVFKVSREAGVVKYYKNGAVIYTSTVAAATSNLYSLRPDMSVGSSVATIPNVIASFDRTLLVSDQVVNPGIANNDGSITNSVFGSYDPVSYSWSSGETTASISGKPRGTYTLTATDANAHTFTNTYTLGYPVAWEVQGGVTINADNSLTKTGAAGWTSGGTGLNILPPNTDGFVEFTWLNNASQYVAGVSRLNNDAGYTYIDFSFSINGSLLQVWESGVSKGTFGSCVTGDVLRISREAGAIKYYRNGALIYTSAVAAASFNLRPDVSINNVGAKIPTITASFDQTLVVRAIPKNPTMANNDGAISVSATGGYAPVTYSWSSGETTASISNKPRGTYTVTVTDAQGRVVTKSYSLGYDIAWTNQSGVAVNADNTIIKTLGTAGYNAGASSLNILNENADGWIEFVINDPTITYAIALTRGDRDLTNTLFNYSWGVSNATGSITTNLNNLIQTTASFVNGDVIRIGKVGSNVNFYINGVINKTVAGSAGYLLLVDISVYNAGTLPLITASFDQQIRIKPTIVPPLGGNANGSISVNVSGTYPPSAVSWSSGETTTAISNKAMGSYTVSVSDAQAGHTGTATYGLGYKMVWSGLQNASVRTDNSLLKTTATNAYDAGAISLNVLPASTNGWVEFVADKAGQSYLVGLARTNATAAIASTDYGIQVTAGDITIYELGVSRGVFANFKEGDVYRISREGTNIVYYKNGVALRTVATTATYVLYADVSLYQGNSACPPVVSSFAPTAAKSFYSIANGPWTSATTWSLTDGGAPAASAPTLLDNVYVKGYSVSVSSSVQCLNLNVLVTTPSTAVVVDGSSAQLTVSGAANIKGQGNNDVSKALVVQNNAKLTVIDPIY